MNEEPSAGDEGASNAGVGAPLGQAEMIALFSEMRPELLRVLVRRTRSPDLAADLAQDVFVKLMALDLALPDHQQARAYIFRMAINLATDRARMDNRRAAILSGAQVLFEDVETDPETLAVTRGQIRQVEKALAELPAKCGEVLMLVRIHGLSHKEVAQRLGVSVSLVEKYQLRALRHCRHRLKDRR